MGQEDTLKTAAQFIAVILISSLAPAAVFAQGDDLSSERVTLCTSGPLSVSISEDRDSTSSDSTQIARKALITVDDKVVGLFYSVNRTAQPKSIEYSAGSPFSLKLDLSREHKKSLAKGFMLRSTGRLDADLPQELASLKPFGERMSCTRFWIY
jgi:hypothetical protein